MRLGHICSEWRDVILSAPQLWSQFTLNLGYSLSDEIPYSQLLLLYVKNSGNSPFRLEVFLDDLTHLHLSIKTVEILHKHVPKVHTLIIDGIYGSPQQDFPQFPESWLSSIENLQLSTEVQFIHSRVLFDGFTHLRKLELDSVGYSKDIQLPWEQLTSLKLNVWPVDLCMSFLVRCPNLVEFHALEITRPEAAIDPRLPGHAHKLEHLSWGFRLLLMCFFFPHQLRFPSLRTFHWHSQPRSMPPEPHIELAEDEMGALRSLVSNLPPNISQLHLFNARAWSDEFTEFIFVKLKGLKIVRFIDCDPLIVVHFLSLLCRVNDWGDYCILPSLAEIHIKVFDFYEENRARLEGGIASHVLPLFRLRDPHKTKQFSLRVVQDNKTVSKRMHKVYASLKKDGYAFKVWYHHGSNFPLLD